MTPEEATNHLQKEVSVYYHLADWLRDQSLDECDPEALRGLAVFLCEKHAELNRRMGNVISDLAEMFAFTLRGPQDYVAPATLEAPPVFWPYTEETEEEPPCE